MSKSIGKESRTDMTFEQGMLGLEAIVERLEKEEMPLDKMVDLFEEGVKLSKYCTEKLDSLQGRINMIVKETDSLREIPFTSGDTDE